MTPCVARLVFPGIRLLSAARPAVLVGMRPRIRQRDFRADFPRCWTQRRLGYESDRSILHWPIPLILG